MEKQVNGTMTDQDRSQSISEYIRTPEPVASARVWDASGLEGDPENFDPGTVICLGGEVMHNPGAELVPFGVRVLASTDINVGRVAELLSMMADEIGSTTDYMGRQEAVATHASPPWWALESVE